MRQKYVLEKKDGDQQLIIKEFAELDKDLMSLLCEETYDFETIEAAVAIGRERLVRTLRTHNLYPPSIYAAKIAEAVIALFGQNEKDSLELFFDDVELLTRERQSTEVIEDYDEDSDDLDDLLEDDSEDIFDEKNRIKKPDSSLKIEDEQYSADEDNDG